MRPDQTPAAPAADEHPTTARARLIELDDGPRTPATPPTDAATWTEATGATLKHNERLEGADAWGERYAPVTREAALARARSGVEALPALAVACDNLARRVQAENRAYVETPLRACYLDNSGELRRGDGSKGALPLTERGFAGLVSRAPANVPRGLRANVNSWIARSEAQARLRVLRPNGTRPTVFAVVSDKYQQFDADEAAALVKRTLPPECRGSVRYSGDGGRWQVEAIMARPFNAPGVKRADEIHSIAIRLRGADDGTTSVSWDAKAVRWICANGIRIADTALLGRVRHVGARERFTEGLIAATTAAQKAAQSFAARWGHANESRFTCADSGEAITAVEAIRRLVSHGSLHVPHVRDLEERILAAWDKERGDSVASVINAATRLAHEGADSWKSEWYQDDLEDQAGELLYQRAYTLRPIAEGAEA